MAIALDTSAKVVDTTAGTNVTLTGYNMGVVSNGILFAGFQDFGSSADEVSSATFNAVAMTRIRFQAGTGAGVYLYYIVAPASGSHDIVFNLSASRKGAICAISFSGASQTGVPVASNSGTGAPTASTGSIASNLNSWAVIFMGDSTWGQSPAITSSTQAQTYDDAGDTAREGSLNYAGPLSAGTVSYDASNNGGANNAVIGATFDPVASANTGRSLGLIGVGK